MAFPRPWHDRRRPGALVGLVDGERDDAGTAVVLVLAVVARAMPTVALPMPVVALPMHVEAAAGLTVSRSRFAAHARGRTRCSVPG